MLKEVNLSRVRDTSRNPHHLLPEALSHASKLSCILDLFKDEHGAQKPL